MSDERPINLTADEAAAVLAPGEYVHCFMNPAGMLVGADWKREQVLELLAGSPSVQITGGISRGMKHGIVAQDDKGRMCFFQTEPSALDALEASKAQSEGAPKP